MTADYKQRDLRLCLCIVHVRSCSQSIMMSRCARLVGHALQDFMMKQHQGSTAHFKRNGPRSIATVILLGRGSLALGSLVPGRGLRYLANNGWHRKLQLFALS